MTDLQHATIDVGYIAQLAQLNLTEAEAAQFAKDLGSVLQYVAQLEDVNVEGVEGMLHPFTTMDVMREDMVKEGLTQEAVLANAPEQALEQIRVPKVVESA